VDAHSPLVIDYMGNTIANQQRYLFVSLDGQERLRSFSAVGSSQPLFRRRRSIKHILALAVSERRINDPQSDICNALENQHIRILRRSAGIMCGASSQLHPCVLEHKRIQRRDLAYSGSDDHLHRCWNCRLRLSRCDPQLDSAETVVPAIQYRHVEARLNSMPRFGPMGPDTRGVVGVGHEEGMAGTVEESFPAPRLKQ
jgi:hypothetical protein